MGIFVILFGVYYYCISDGRCFKWSIKTNCLMIRNECTKLSLKNPM